MLEGLSDPVRAFHERALEAKRKGHETSAPALKASYLDIESRWLVLARSYGFTESLNSFTAANAARRLEFDAKALHQKPDRFLERVRASALFDLLPVALYVCDPDGLILYYNETAAQLWGRALRLMDPADRFCGSYRMWHLDGDPIPRVPHGRRVAHWPTGDRQRDHRRAIGRLARRRAGQYQAFKDASGKMLGAVNCFQDITERKQHAQQIAVLAREAEHRSKNILATAQATVHLSNSDTTEGLNCAIEGRIKALADVHALFLESRWAGAKLFGIAQQELLPCLRDGEPRVRSKDPMCRSTPRWHKGSPSHCMSWQPTPQSMAHCPRLKVDLNFNGLALPTLGLCCSGWKPAGRS